MSPLSHLDGAPKPEKRDPPTLPVELWDLIASFLPARADLASLASVSHLFYHISARHLYRDLSLRRGVSTVQQCLSLSRQPQLQQHVRSMGITFGLDASDRAGASRTRTYARQPTEMFAPAYTRLFFRLYSRLSQLRLQALSFSCHMAFDDLLRQNLALHPPLVKNFEIGARGPPAELLNHLPQVERLYMLKLFGCNIDSLSSLALPKLRAVRCSLRQAEVLIPGRPVQDVALEATTLDLDHLPRVVDTLLMSTSPIRGLDLKLRSFELDTFACIGAVLPELREFVLTVLDVPQLELFDLAPEEWLARGRLNYFTHLASLEIHAFYGPLPPAGVKVPLLPLITHIGLSCSSLRTVTIVDRGSTHAHEAAVPAYSMRRVEGGGSRRSGSAWKKEMHWRNCRNRRSPLFASWGESLLGEPAEVRKPPEKVGAPQCWVM